MVDVQVALGLDRYVDARVAGQEIEHVVEEADAGRNLRTALPVEVDFDLHVGFLGFALHGASAHDENPLISRAFYQGFSRFATAPAPGAAAMPSARSTVSERHPPAGVCHSMD